MFLLIPLLSFILMYCIHVGNDTLGNSIAENWCSIRGFNSSDPATCLVQLNSNTLIFSQTLSLTLFLLTIALVVIKTEWRTGAAILCLAPLLTTGIVPPQYFIEAVSWSLILFLVGSMTLAGILKELGVFRFIAVKFLEMSRGKAVVLLFLIALMAFILSATLDEVTSVVYVVMLILEVYRLTGIDPIPLLVFSVLATNTGSVALPIGNPIGVFLLFKTKMSISRYIAFALPIAIVNLIVMFFVTIWLNKSFMKKLEGKLGESIERINALIVKYRIELSSGNKTLGRFKGVRLGLTIFILFILTIAFNDHITHLISYVCGTRVDPHSFLSFIPYTYIAILLLLVVPLSEVSVLIEKAVEWRSLVFFIFLFMFSYALTYTGVMAKLAYFLIHVTTNPHALYTLMLLSSALLSSLLDNLSVIVTFTPVAILFNKIGLAGDPIYFALLYGGVFGGNYTPIGSTANIVALSIAEKRKIKISWSNWLKISIITTTLQLVIALLWLYLHSTIRI